MIKIKMIYDLSIDHQRFTMNKLNIKIFRLFKRCLKYLKSIVNLQFILFDKLIIIEQIIYSSKINDVKKIFIMNFVCPKIIIIFIRDLPYIYNEYN